MPDPALKQALTAKHFILAPGVYDMISALIADRMGFKALYVTGYGTVASHLGIPDAGIATYRDMVERIAQIVK
ncbi:MAG: isocitrate lyase/phosphoenolpyruvate mutase family protein, partial [Rhizobium sp.]|nr:isocitrate lyase/phosphoenolpyruvate mutase family protein [Rhizobium sp.]